MFKNSIGDTIVRIHKDLHSQFEQLCRIAVAVYDESNDMLKTFAHSTDGQSPLTCYQAKLATVPSLKILAQEKKPRVLHDLTSLEGSPSEHSEKILLAGFKSSYTTPLIFDNKLIGFLFFDAKELHYFTDALASKIESYSSMLTALIVMQFSSIKTLNGAIVTAREFSRQRDEETANHLQRMSNYSHLIAKYLAKEFNLSDEDVEFIYRFSQLHDIGKIAIADSILLKQGKLTAEEYKTIQTHVDKGSEMTQFMVDEFGLNSIHHIKLLQNIISGHHEHFDGKGYPKGLKGEEIPIEARIVAVADVFDALTSERPYKHAWNLDDAFNYLRKNSGTHFDPKCVAAALSHAEEFKMINLAYKDEAFF